MSNQFVVRWIDQNKENQEKVYHRYDEASKAYKYLLKNGAGSVDIAIVKKPKPEPSVEPV